MSATNLSFFKYLFSSLLIVVLASCATINQDRVSHLIKVTDPKIFKIVSFDESGNEINDRLILEALQQNISKLSLYPSFYSAIDDLNENVSGFEAIIINNNSIKIQYLNGKLSPSGKHRLTKAAATFNIEINKDNYGLFKTVTVFPAKSLTISRVKQQFGSVKTLDTPDKLRKDVEHIFKNINLSLERLIFISGEIIVRNSDDEVYDNFEHLLGLYSKKSFQEKDMIFGIFQLKSNSRKDIIPVRVRIFPNSKGSRVKYEFDIKYSIKPDGTTTYNEQEINYLITTIKNISTTKDLDAPLEHFKVNNKNLVAIIDDPVLVSNYTKSSPIDIHETSITYRPTKKSKPKSTKKKMAKNNKQKANYKSKKINKAPKTKKLGIEQKVSSNTSDSEPKSNNVKNIEYIEKMLSSLKKQRPSR